MDAACRQYGIKYLKSFLNNKSHRRTMISIVAKPYWTRLPGSDQFRATSGVVLWNIGTSE